MSHPSHLAIVILVAAVTAASARATAGDAIWMSNGDDTDQPSVRLATGDFNGDGIADIVKATVADKGAHQYVLTVQLGQSDGSLRDVASHYPIGGDPRALVVGDFNKDGNLDVIVGDGGGAVLEFFGDGKGNLVDAGSVATLGSVASIAVGDLTHDGKLDLVVSDFRSNSAVILLGGGNGSFRFSWSFELPRRGTEFRIAIADFNADGIADLVITSEDDSNYEVMLGNDNGTFTYAPELSHLRDPNSYCPS